MKSESIKFVDITNNPHFSQFAALLSVPFHSRHWREAHPHVPFWTLWDDCVKLQKEEFFEDGATAFIEKFANFIISLREADTKLFYRLEDIRWFDEVMRSENALLTMSMLFAMASSKDTPVTPTQIAAQTNTSESEWHKRAQNGDFVGAYKPETTGEWLIPVLALRAWGIIVNPLKESNQYEENV